MTLELELGKDTDCIHSLRVCLQCAVFTVTIMKQVLTLTFWIWLGIFWVQAQTFQLFSTKVFPSALGLNKKKGRKKYVCSECVCVQNIKQTHYVTQYTRLLLSFDSFSIYTEWSGECTHTQVTYFISSASKITM